MIIRMATAQVLSYRIHALGLLTLCELQVITFILKQVEVRLAIELLFHCETFLDMLRRTGNALFVSGITCMVIVKQRYRLVDRE